MSVREQAAEAARRRRSMLAAATRADEGRGAAGDGRRAGRPYRRRSSPRNAEDVRPGRDRRHRPTPI